MDLSKFIPKKEEPKPEYYWSLVIEPSWVASGIWTIFGNRAKVLTVSPPAAWEEKEELINASDSVLSAAVQNFSGEGDDLTKTVFGVSTSWVQNGQIKEEYLSTIKEVCSKLSLVPIGFVVIPEAISHYLKSEEGVTPNIVAVGLYKDAVEISVFRNGKLAGTTSVSRSVNIDEDVVEGLSRFVDKEPIPTRFILYNSKEGELEEAKQSLIKVNWEDYQDLKLLHTPKIEILSSEDKVRAVCLAGASEISNVSGLDEENKEMPSSLPPLPEVPNEKTFAVRDEKKSDREFAVGMAGHENDESELSSIDELKESEVTNVIVPEDKKVPKRKLSINLSATFGFLGFLLSPFEKKPFVFGIISLGVVVVLGFVYWWFFPKATVTVLVSPRKLEEKITVRVSTQVSQIDHESNTIPGQMKETSVSGDATSDTTGTKTVGDLAKGEVKLYRVGPSIAVKLGTLLYGPEDLNFVMDEGVNVATGTAGSPGVSSVKVTAEKIGSQYNLASGTNFIVGNFSTSDIEAKNDSAFSGGSSRQISAVSESDAISLLSSLKEELLDRAVSEVSQTLGEGELIVEGAALEEITAEKYNSKVGDEADTLKLELEMDVRALVVSSSNLEDLVVDEMKSKVPDGYTMPGSQITHRFELTESSDDSYEFLVSVSANLVPSVDEAKLKRNIRGKYVGTVGEILETEVPGYSGVEIKIRPPLVGRLKTIPRVLKNISIEISGEK